MARWQETLTQVPARGEVVLALFASPIATEHGNPHRAIGTQPNRFLKECAKAGGISIGSEPHDLVLVRIEIESEMQRNQGIQNSDRIHSGYLRKRIEFSMAAQICRGALC